MSENTVRTVSSHAWTWALIVAAALLVFEVSFAPIQAGATATPVQTVQASDVQAG